MKARIYKYEKLLRKRYSYFRRSNDIGRRYGVTNERHSLDGYKFAIENGYDLWARICITHAYLCKNVDDICGKKDCTVEERNFIKGYLDNIEFSAYDKWKATFEIQRYFEERIGTSIYSILPNVKETTLGF